MENGMVHAAKNNPNHQIRVSAKENIQERKMRGFLQNQRLFF